MWKHDARRAECFNTISSFSNFHECSYNCISIRKNVLYFFYNIAQKTLTEEWREIFRVDKELYQHGSKPISVQNLHMLYYNALSYCTKCLDENVRILS